MTENNLSCVVLKVVFKSHMISSSLFRTIFVKAVFTVPF